MAAIETPHFDIPFRFDATSAVCVEQDSIEDITNCVEAVMRYPTGFREDLPEFGIPDQVFTEGNLDVEAVRASVEYWEPRAITTMDEEMDLIDVAARTLNVSVGVENG